MESSDGYRYLDVRTISEFRKGHIPGAFNIPIAHIVNPELANWSVNGQFLAVARANFPLDSPLIVGCRSGKRSLVATQIMIEAGHSRVYNLAGNWKDLGYPIEQGDGDSGSYKSLFSVMANPRESEGKYLGELPAWQWGRLTSAAKKPRFVGVKGNRGASPG